MSFKELSSNIILRNLYRFYFLTTIKVKVNHDMKFRPSKLLVQFVAVCLLHIQFNHATAGITEQMPLADKFAQQPWFKSAAIGMMDLDTYGKCGNVFSMALIASAKGAKFDDNTSYGIALLGSAVGIVRRNFLANGYPDSYLVEVLKYHGNIFKEEYVLECSSMVIKAIEDQSKVQNGNTKSDVISSKPSNAKILSGTVGVFSFKFNAPPGWKILNHPDSNVRVIDLLNLDGADFKPNFVFENEKTGSLMYGFWRENRKGTVFSAEQLALNLPPFPKDWDIDDNQVISVARTSKKGLAYSVLRVVGQGDGNTFARKNKSVKTLAIWIDIPFQFEVSGYPVSALFCFYYRGPDFNPGKSAQIVVDNQKMPGDILITDLIDSLTLDSTVRPLTVEEYKRR